MYIIGRNRISQITLKNGTEQELYFTFDGHGSTRVLTDLAGAILEFYAFDAYGNAIGFDPSVALTEFLYSGEQFDSKIGQQYLRARYYDPTTGRFNRLDPFFGNLVDPLSLHKYAYAHNAPIDGTDPSGKFAFIPVLLTAMGIGGLVGVAVGGYKYGLKGIIPGFFGGALLVGGILGAAAIVTGVMVLPSIAITAGLAGLGTLGLYYTLYDPPCRISRQMAIMYTYRGLLGLTIIGQIETRNGGYCKVVMDDGSMMDSIGTPRLQWLVEYAYEQKNIRPKDGLVHVEIDEYVETWLKPSMESWWISQMSGLKVSGSYDIEFYINETGKTQYRLSNRNLNWLGWDRIDTNPEKEWNDKKYTKWFIESIVGIVGDSMLGADFPVYVYAYEYNDRDVYEGGIQ